MGGIMDYKARFYSPCIMQFHQRDTLIPEPYNPQSYNRYSYGLNNPSRYTDPTGHMVDDESDGAGCSGQGPKCIMDMYGAYGDEDGMMDSLRSFVRRHKDYNPQTDLELSDEGRAIVSVAMFHVAAQDTPVNASLWDIIKAAWPSAASLFLSGLIVDGWETNMSPDEGGGGWSTGRGPKNAIEQAAWDKVVADPWNGRELPFDLGDPRWPAEEGWVKMERTVNGVEIHWNLNKFTGAVEDMKIP